MTVRSALCAVPATLYPQEDPWLRLSRPQRHRAAKICWSNKKSNVLIGNQTSDLQAFSIGYQPTTPRVPLDGSGMFLKTTIL
jgi:hypothetical protein